MQIKRIQQRQVRPLTEHFQCSKLGEKRARFQDRLGGILGYPRTHECYVVSGSGDEPLALVAFGKKATNTLEVPLIRIAKGPLGVTIARNLMWRAFVTSAVEMRPIIRVTDPCLVESVKNALCLDGFVKTNEGWVKVSLSVAAKSEQLAETLVDLISSCGHHLESFRELVDCLKEGKTTTDVGTAVRLERLLWPAKVMDSPVPTFIVAIEPRWAKELFDEELASQDLFGGRTEIGLAREAVYYRSRLPGGGLSAPGRILWYVSDDPHYHGSKHVRACSYIDEISIGKPKDLFRRFRRLGVYNWRDVFDLARKDLEMSIMAIRFSSTELFAKPIPWRNLQRILSEEGCPSQIQSPHRIPGNTFSRLYALATNRQ